MKFRTGLSFIKHLSTKLKATPHNKREYLEFYSDIMGQTEISAGADLAEVNFFIGKYMKTIELLHLTVNILQLTKIQLTLHSYLCYYNDRDWR